MGCFLTCFGTSKDKKLRAQIKNKVLPGDRRHGIQKPRQSTLSSEQDVSAEPTNLIPEVPILLDIQANKLEEQMSLSTRKKVTFNTNVKAYEPISVHESTEFSLQNGEDITNQKSDSLGIPSLSPSQFEDDSITSNDRSCPYPPNHRYQNCRDSDDEADEYENESEASDLDDEDKAVEDYSDYEEDEESQIFVPIESRTEIESGQTFPKEEVKLTAYNNPSVRDRSGYVHPVLNPVENLTQWKAVKSKGSSPLNPQKENLKLEQEEPPRISFSSEPIFKHSSFTFKSKSDQPKSQNQDIAVDASLSNWLVTSETTPPKKTRTFGLETISQEKSFSQGSNSVVSIEDRPILGALTVEELKQFSASSSPRRSSSRSPDEMVIIGTVGTYWRHTGQGKDSGSTSSYKGIPNTTSKYSEVPVK